MKTTPTVPSKTLLPLECIALDVDVTKKEQVFDEISRLVHARHQLRPAEVVSRLWKRERRSSTALGDGVALPHAHVVGLARPVAVFLRPKEPVPFEAPDGKPVTELLALLVPRPATAVHYELLKHYGRLLTSRSFRIALQACTEVQEVWQLFGQWPL